MKAVGVVRWRDEMGRWDGSVGLRARPLVLHEACLVAGSYAIA